MAKKDYYEVLGLARGATEADIKKAYRKLAMKHHPDRNAGNAASEEQFKAVNQAYEVLSDPKKRSAYDQFGHAAVDGSAGQAQGPGGVDLGDIFGNIFGDIFGGGGRGGPNRGAYGTPGSDLRYVLDLSLEEAVRGKTVEIQVPTWVKCTPCKGSGAKPGTEPKACGTCRGEGQVRVQQGFFSLQQACPACQGRGRLVADPCTACKGQGRVQERKKLSVRIPPGVDQGDRIRLNGEGEAGAQGGPPGDLYVEMRIKAHNIFTREGIHLHSEVPISFSMAALGTELDVPTLDGRIKLKIPSGTQSAQTFRLRAKGVKSIRGEGPGDLFCRVIVETPVHLTKRQKELLEELESTFGESDSSHSPHATSWFARVKQFFDELKDG